MRQLLEGGKEKTSGGLGPCERCAKQCGGEEKADTVVTREPGLWATPEAAPDVKCSATIQDLAVVPREKPHTGAAAREQPRASPVIAT